MPKQDSQGGVCKGLCVGQGLFSILDNHASIGREPFQKMTYSEYKAHLVLATLVLYGDRMADHDVAEGGDSDLVYKDNFMLLMIR